MDLVTFKLAMNLLSMFPFVPSLKWTNRYWKLKKSVEFCSVHDVMNEKKIANGEVMSLVCLLCCYVHILCFWTVLMLCDQCVRRCWNLQNKNRWTQCSHRHISSSIEIWWILSLTFNSKYKIQNKWSHVNCIALNYRLWRRQFEFEV